MAIVEPYGLGPGQARNPQQNQAPDLGGALFRGGGGGSSGFAKAVRAARRTQIGEDRGLAKDRNAAANKWLDADYGTVKERWERQKGYFDQDVEFLKQDKTRAYDEIAADLLKLDTRFGQQQADFAQDRGRLGDALDRALGDLGQDRLAGTAATVRSGLGGGLASGAMRRVGEQFARSFDNRSRDLRLGHEEAMIGLGRQERYATDQNTDARDALRRQRTDISVRYDRAREQNRRNRQDQLDRHMDATKTYNRSKEELDWQIADTNRSFDRELQYMGLQDKYGSGSGGGGSPFSSIGW